MAPTPTPLDHSHSTNSNANSSNTPHIPQDLYSKETFLQNSEERFRALVQVTQSVFWSCNAEACFENFQPSWFELTGQIWSQQSHYGWFDAIHPSDRQNTKHYFLESCSQQTIFETSIRIWQQSMQEYRYFILRAVPVFSIEHPKVIKEYIGICVDIHELQMAQEELRRNQEMYKLLTDIIYHLVWINDPTGKVEHMNQRFLNFVGLGMEEAKSLPWYSFISSDDLPRIKELYSAATFSQSPMHAEYRLIDKNGHPHWVMTKLNPLKNKQGTVIEWHGSATFIKEFKEARDKLEQLYATSEETIQLRLKELEETNRNLANLITAKQEAQEQIQQVEERYRLLASMSPVGIMHLDINGMLKYVNPAFLQMTDMERQEMIDRHWIDFVYEEDQYLVFKAWHQLCLQGQLFNLEFRIISKSTGKLQWVLCKIAAEKKEQQVIQSYVGTLTNITDVKRLEKERMDAISEAEVNQRHRVEEAQNHIKKQIQYIDLICHDIRNPCFGLHGSVQVAKELIQDFQYSVLNEAGEDVKQILQKRIDEILGNIQSMDECIKHQSMITDDALSFSKLQSNSFEVEYSEFDPKDIIEWTSSMFGSHLKQKGLKLIYDYPEKEEFKVKTDDKRLKQLLVNIMTNSVKFTYSGSIELGYSIKKNETDSSKGILTFKVKDTGIGISEEDLKKLFKAFSQANRHISNTFGGSGLGLVICDQIIKALNGKIEIESVIDRGTTFIIEVPCTIIASSKSQTSLQQQQTSSTQVNTNFTSDTKQTKFVLIVEDNSINQKVLASFLQKKGYEYKIANNGQEALKIFEESYRDILIITMDLEMPILNGYDATIQIRQKETEMQLPKIPIICVTGNARQEHKLKAIQAGMDDFLAKPFTKEQLFLKMDHLLQSH